MKPRRGGPDTPARKPTPGVLHARAWLTPRVAVRSFVAAARYRLTGHRAPLAAHISVTTRCDALCTYCAIPLRKTKELDTQELVELVDGFARRGVVRVSLGGGEPLVRDDIGILVERCADHGMFCQLETNGYRYPARAHELDRVGELVLSYDGEERAHDLNREPGSWEQARAALRLARARGVPVRLRATLTRHNIDQVEHVIATAEAHDALADFQILQHAPLLAEPLAKDLAAPPEALRAALRRVLEARQAGRPVSNTEKSLRYLLSWEDFGTPTARAPHEDLHCLAGQLYVAVDADGTMNPCALWSGRFPGRSVRGGLDGALEAVRDNPCRACTCATLAEYNFLYNLNGPALVERLCAPEGRPFRTPRKDGTR